MDKLQSKAPCFLCDATAFEWRWVQGGNGHEVKLRPLNETAWTLFAEREKVKARLCLNCGNVLLFAADFADES